MLPIDIRKLITSFLTSSVMKQIHVRIRNPENCGICLQMFFRNQCKITCGETHECLLAYRQRAHLKCMVYSNEGPQCQNCYDIWYNNEETGGYYEDVWQETVGYDPLP